MIVVVLNNKGDNGFQVHYTDGVKSIEEPIRALSLNEIRKIKEQQEQNILIVPTEIVNNSRFMLVCTEEHSQQVKEALPEIKDRLVLLKEKINAMGKIEIDVAEPEINKMLRLIFQKRPDKIYVCLTNSIQNSQHEKILRNVIKGAGYKVERTFLDFD